jgi:hypothetical protein
MIVLAYIINLLAPLVNFVGLLGLFACIIYEDLSVLLFDGVIAVVGLVFGIFAYKLDIPPRWSWSKSKNDLFRFSVTAVLGYAGSLAMWPCAIYMVKVIADAVANAA